MRQYYIFWQDMVQYCSFDWTVYHEKAPAKHKQVVHSMVYTEPTSSWRHHNEVQYVCESGRCADCVVYHENNMSETDNSALIYD